MSLAACFSESQLIDSGDGKNFGLQLTMPAPVTYSNANGGVLVSAGQSLNDYETGQPAAPGAYWLIIDRSGNATVLQVAHRAVKDLGVFGFFQKQNGVIFCVPRDQQNDSAFAFVYKAK